MLFKQSEALLLTCFDVMQRSEERIHLSVAKIYAQNPLLV